MNYSSGYSALYNTRPKQMEIHILALDMLIFFRGIMVDASIPNLTS